MSKQRCHGDSFHRGKVRTGKTVSSDEYVGGMRLKEITWRKSGEEGWRDGRGEEQREEKRKKRKGRQEKNSEDSIPVESNIKMLGR